MSTVIVSQCTYRCVVLPDIPVMVPPPPHESQCTYRCVVLPDDHDVEYSGVGYYVSMHLQVRGAP